MRFAICFTLAPINVVKLNNHVVGSEVLRSVLMYFIMYFLL